ncbi:TatD family deoxyribonuclease [Candidatus Saccharibacteria bacterium]|nr:TatD family deoxyribonuclease [Candidatus Saccharibacteria bacterium]
MLIDTHAHIHFDDFEGDLADVFSNAHASQVGAIITVGTTPQDSLKALEFVMNTDVIALAHGIKLYATAGIHPHEASLGSDGLKAIKQLASDSKYRGALVAIGECGLDYYRNNSPKAQQLEALEFQLQLAKELELPLVFHVRDGWQDFFATLGNYPKVRGVIHSFTGTTAEVEQALGYDLFFGLNGIMTFTKDQAQLEAAKIIPANKLLLETDCPYLSPIPFRGKRNEPSFVKYSGEFLAELRGEQYPELINSTTTNAKALFKLK